MAPLDLLLVNGRVVVPAGETRVAVGVSAGRVVALLDAGARPPAREVIDVGGKAMLRASSIRTPT